MLHPSTDVIANAYSFYIAEQSNTNLTKLLRAVSNLLREGADVQIPVSLAAQAQGQLALVTHTTSEGQVYVAAFSSEQAFDAKQSEEYTLIARPLVNYFEAVLQMEGITGIVFNPTSPAPFTIQKKMLKELLKQLAEHPEIAEYIKGAALSQYPRGFPDPLLRPFQIVLLRPPRIVPLFSNHFEIRRVRDDQINRFILDLCLHP